MLFLVQRISKNIPSICTIHLINSICQLLIRISVEATLMHTLLQYRTVSKDYFLKKKTYAAIKQRLERKANKYPSHTSALGLGQFSVGSTLIDSYHFFLPPNRGALSMSSFCLTVSKVLSILADIFQVILNLRMVKPGQDIGKLHSEDFLSPHKIRK